MISPNSSTPLYTQIKERLKELIQSGAYPEGSKLPSEKELCEKYNVSRITVRKAIEQLETSGMIYSVHGKGTFVKNTTIDSSLMKISSFADTLAQKGFQGFTRITSYEECQLDDFDRMMHGNDWESLSRIALTGYSEDEPVVFYKSVIRNPYGKEMHAKAQQLEKKNIAFSTFDLYKEIGVRISKINQQILAINADEEIARILHLNPGDAVLVLDSTIKNSDNVILEYKKGYYRTDKYAFTLQRKL